jgi:hypothetical protein
MTTPDSVIVTFLVTCEVSGAGARRDLLEMAMTNYLLGAAVSVRDGTGEDTAITATDARVCRAAADFPDGFVMPFRRHDDLRSFRWWADREIDRLLASRSRKIRRRYPLAMPATEPGEVPVRGLSGRDARDLMFHVGYASALEIALGYLDPLFPPTVPEPTEETA